MPQSNAERQRNYRERNGVTPKASNVTTNATRKPRSRRKPTANQIASNIGGILQMGNEMAVTLAPAYRPDALLPYEIELLSQAAAAEILGNVTLLKWYQSVGSNISGAHTLAVAAIVAVALPRLARRNMVPQNLAVMGANLALGLSNIGAEVSSNEPSSSAVQDDAGAAHSSNGHDGFREVRVGPGAPGLTLVPADSPDQTGQHPIRD